ncbi:LOW QUALITY PROTEIN: glucokinase regulatory protein [Ciconia maguari]
MRGMKKYRHVIETLDPGRAASMALPAWCGSTSVVQGCGLGTERLLCGASLEPADARKDPENGVIVLGGSGRSGRLAFLIAISFNKLLKGLGQLPRYEYIIAGGDRSLVMSQEGLEDSALLGIEELRKVCGGKKKVVFIGISCGLSTPFVAEQLDFCTNNLDNFLPVLVGFNPVSMARNDKIEGWHSTFLQVAEWMQKLQESHKAFILNPAVGVSSICGSSWVKGGSATKILLETMLLAAHRTVSRESDISENCLMEILRTCDWAHKVTCAQSRKIAALVKQAGMSMQKNACVYLVGYTVGLIAITDGVECIPTFGADNKDVQGFLIGDIFNKEMDLIAQSPQFSFSQEDFVKIILPSLTALDTVLFLFTLDGEVEELVVQVKENTSNIQALSHATVGQYLAASLKKLFPAIISIMWPILFLEYNFIKFQRELSIKWILNIVSTGAHILKGKILCNCMVDLWIGNSKLFWRAVPILQRFTGHSQATCLGSLLQVIYDSEVLDDLRHKEISTHILVATEKTKVVPTALLCLLRNCLVQEARMHLDTSHSISPAIEASLNAPGCKQGADKSDAASRIT